jgi:glycogen operon protein
VAYYRLDPSDRRYYIDFTGTGNTFNVPHRRAMQLLMDSLRYWVTEMHVDGFRFDLASALARELYSVNRLGRFFDIVRQDPVISRVKLIAEPWDLGEGGYQVGNFPVGWAEWNGKYRDTVRRFWRGDNKQVADMAYRLSGSSDLYGDDERSPHASINYVTSHDGFTLRDLVSYERKHNEANAEGNRDGTDANWSSNWGIEGPTGEMRIVELRERVMYNSLATLAFSQGVPMISHGDEMGRTQDGNNNAYCQDNPLTWMNWDLDARARKLLSFAQAVFAMRAANPVLRRRTFFHGQPITQTGTKDVSWLRATGEEMTAEDWQDPRRHIMAMLIHGRATDERDERGRLATGETVLFALNGGGRSRRFKPPKLEENGRWIEALNTARPGSRLVRGDAVSLVARSCILFRYELL